MTFPNCSGVFTLSSRLSNRSRDENSHSSMSTCVNYRCSSVVTMEHLRKASFAGWDLNQKRTLPSLISSLSGKSLIAGDVIIQNYIPGVLNLT
ncbi:hypothetical protein TNCV_3816701 [Trichonephila clavipes]|nr:hypothetical protein TNCV_3816701 [Trichonephila clavipes]